MNAVFCLHRGAKWALKSAIVIGLMTSSAVAQEALRLGPGRSSKKDKGAAKAPTPTPKATEKAALPRATESTLSSISAIELPASYSGSRADTWDSVFAARRKTPKSDSFSAGVRAKVRRLVAKEDFAQVQEIISAAMRNDAVETWMYEAYALALEATGASEKELERAILSAVDLNRNLDSALTAADYLVSLKLDVAALRLFQDIASQDPNRTEPYLQGLKSAQRIQDAAAIRWCCLGILRQAWAGDERNVESHARRIAEATILDMEAAGRLAEAKQFAEELKTVLARDVRVRVWWTGDADVDLSVLEPTGEVCSYRNPRTAGGGQILGDAFARSSTSAPREGFTETFICPEGFSGQYQVLLKKVWGEVAGRKVNVEVITHFGAANETTVIKQLPLGVDGTLVNFELAAGRRTEPLPEARASSATKRQIDVARHVLFQQLSSSSGSAASESYYTNNQPFVVDPMGRLAFVPRGAVGFRPQITTLRDGPVLFAGPAVVSADRRFVRVRLSPQFSTIGEVQTFNFATGSTGNGNGTGNTGGTSGGFGGGTGGGTGGTGGGGTGGGVGT